MSTETRGNLRFAAGRVACGVCVNDVILAPAGPWQLDPASTGEPERERIYTITLRGLQ